MINVTDLSIRQGSFVLSGVTFEVQAGRYAVLMGKTGSGKTSVLEAICGLRSIAGGKIWLGGRDVTELPPGARGIGYVPQDSALFPTMTIHDHLAFAMRLRARPRREIEQRVETVAEWLGIAHLLDRYPGKLSGGEAQRVAIGRAIAHEPTVLVLDEPLSALDDETREEMYQLLEKLRSAIRMTVLHVTHNRSDADRLADVTFGLRDGRINEESER